MDTPYIHDENNTDRYPKVVPYESDPPSAGKLPSRLSLWVSEDVDWGLCFGDNESIECSVYDDDSGFKIPNVLVTLLLQKPSGYQKEYVVSTNSDGEIDPIYYVFDESGPWSLIGSWEGNDEYLGAENVYNFDVESKAYSGEDGGIPGFPVESLMLSIILLSMILWMRK